MRAQVVRAQHNFVTQWIESLEKQCHTSLRDPLDRCLLQDVTCLFVHKSSLVSIV